MTTREPALREHLARLVDWGDAHGTFEATLKGLARDARGRVPAGLPYSPWQLLEHVRITQADILSFCVDADYEELSWPDDYWPDTAAPPDDAAWDVSVAAFLRDRDAMKRLTLDESRDLLATVPAGTGQTFLREILLVADHTSYHLGQLVAVRRLLGQWPA